MTLRGCLLALACLLAIRTTPVDATPSLRERVAPLAQKVAEFLREGKHTSLTLGEFTAPDALAAQAGPGLTRALADELALLGIKVVPRSGVVLRGKFAPRKGTGGVLQGVRVTAEVVKGGRVLRTFEGDVPFVGDEKAAEVDGARALAPLLGLTAELPPDKSVKVRLQKFQDGTEKPHVAISGTRMAASSASPYAVEVVVAGAALEPALRGGRAYVDVKKGQSYAVRLINGSDRPAAATLTIDGLSLFAFSDEKGYSYVVVPAKGSALVRGWHRTNEKSEAFEVAGYGKSAAAELMPDSPRIGCITATFATSWPKSAAPPEEERSARLAVSRGEPLATARGAALKATYEEVQSHVGAVRAAVTVRYTRPARPE